MNGRARGKLIIFFYVTVIIISIVFMYNINSKCDQGLMMAGNVNKHYYHTSSDDPSFSEKLFLDFRFNKMRGLRRIPVNNSVLEEKMYIEYVRYVTTIQTTCNTISRCGSKGESGYDVCVDPVYEPKKQCIVYSFGSHFSFGFENDVFRKFNCEIHTFDPSIPLAGHGIPEGVKFHLIGLSDMDHKNELGWEMKTLSSIRTFLNHSYTQIDILKLDIEGYEWKAIPQILASVSSTDIKQLLVEVHFGRQRRYSLKDGFISLQNFYYGYINPYIQLYILKELQHYGFQTFSFLANKRVKIHLVHSNRTIITCYVLSMKNMNIS